MANYTDLINAINTNIVDNDNHLISGSTLNEILLSIVNTHKDSLDEVNAVINTLSEPVNINISGSVNDIASLPTDASAGDLYFVNSDEYVYNGDEWILLGPSVNINNHINVVIPENIYNGISVPLPGYTFFNITDVILRFSANAPTPIDVMLSLSSLNTPSTGGATKTSSCSPLDDFTVRM